MSLGRLTANDRPQIILNCGCIHTLDGFTVIDDQIAIGVDYIFLAICLR